MTRSYMEKRINLETMQPEILAHWSFTVYPGNNDVLTVCRNGITKTVEVKDNSGFTYRLLKTRIEGNGGANGIFKFLDDCLFNEFMECDAWRILHHCIETCRAAK